MSEGSDVLAMLRDEAKLTVIVASSLPTTLKDKWYR